MARNMNRQVLRGMLALMIVTAGVGAWLGNRWHLRPNEIEEIAQIVEGDDWIDLIASLGEQALQIFLALAGASG